LAATASATSAAEPVREPRGPVRLPLLAIALVAFAGFGLDALLALGQLAPGQAAPGWDVSIARAVQAVSWGPLLAVFGWVDWFEGLKQVAAAATALLLVALLNRRGFPLMAW